METGRRGLEEALAIYLATVIIPAGPHSEALDPRAQHSTRLLFWKENPQGRETQGTACQNLTGAGAVFETPTTLFFPSPKKPAKARKGQVLWEDNPS